jgi:hypothetical protein
MNREKYPKKSPALPPTQQKESTPSLDLSSIDDGQFPPAKPSTYIYSREQLNEIRNKPSCSEKLQFLCYVPEIHKDAPVAPNTATSYAGKEKREPVSNGRTRDDRNASTRFSIRELDSKDERRRDAKASPNYGPTKDGKQISQYSRT